MVLFVHSAGGGIKHGLSEGWTVQVLMTHDIFALASVQQFFYSQWKRRGVFLSIFYQHQSGREGKGLGVISIKS